MLQRCLFVAAIVVTTSATAQHVSRSAGLDLGALSVSEVRINLEPFTAGRWSMNMGFARWTGAVLDSREFVRTAEQLQASGLEAMPGNTHLALDFTLRMYPRLLESKEPERRFRTFVGLGAGLTQRTDSRAGTNYPQPFGAPGPADPEIDRALGVDPLAEAGVRFEPARGFLLDIGVRARVVATRDPTDRYNRGNVVPNAVIAVGFGW